MRRRAQQLRTPSASSSPYREEAAQPLLYRQQRASFGTAVCNLGCNSVRTGHLQGRAMRADRVCLPRASQGRQASRRQSIAFTYNDPVIFAESHRLCRCGARAGASGGGGQRRLHRRAAREAFFRPCTPPTSTSSVQRHFYEKLCFARLAPVLETLEYIKRETSVWLESPRC